MSEEVVFKALHQPAYHDPFIYEYYGNLAALDQLAEDIKADTDLFTDGDGDYTFSARYLPEERGEYGIVEFPGGWECSLISFTAVPEGESE